MIERDKTIEQLVEEDHNRRIKDLEGHADVANREMGEVKQHLGVLQNDVKWVKDMINKVDNRTWWILGTLILGTIIQIYFTIKH